MEKMIALLAALVLVFALAGCGSDPEPTTETTTEPTSTEPSTTEAPTETTEESSTALPTESTEPEQELFTIEQTSVQTYRDSMGTVWAMAIAEIRNTGDTPLDLATADMTLTAGGETIAALDFVSAYPQVILPGTSGYYYEVTELDILDTTKLELAVEPHIAEQAAACEYYNVSEQRLQNAPYGGLTFSGKVKNSTSTDGAMVCIAALLLGEEGNVLGIMSTYLPSALAAGAESEFSMDSFMLPEELTAEDVAEITVYAYPISLY